MIDKKGYSLGELAEQHSVSVAFLRKEIGRGKLKKTPMGDRVVILNEDWQEYLADCKKRVSEKEETWADIIARLRNRKGANPC